MRRLVLLAPILLAAAMPPARAESLYDPGTYRPLAADNKAFRVGDAITIQVYESSSATSSADTSTQRKNDLSAALALISPNSTRQYGANASVAGDFQGGGTTQRANKVLTTLTVTVRKVLDTGDLEVAGEQLLTVNQEQHRVVVEGRVRPIDVSGDNVVQSTRLADARITLVGHGDLSERQQRAWWRKLLDWVGL